MSLLCMGIALTTHINMYKLEDPVQRDKLPCLYATSKIFPYRRDNGGRKMNDDFHSPTFEFSTAFLPHSLPHLCPQAKEQKNDLIRRSKADRKL